MALEHELDAVRGRVKAVVGPEDQRIVDATIARNRMLQLAEQSLGNGDTLPDFELPGFGRGLVRSGELLDRGPLVLAFFRGGWCPYCDVALRALEAARPAIEAAGATLAGVTPEGPDALRRTALERKLGFLLLTDKDGAYAKLCGIRYDVPVAHREVYRRLGIDLPARHDGAGWTLPLPATYVVGRDGVIAQVFIDPDWSYRAEPADLVTAVRNMAPSP